MSDFSKRVGIQVTLATIKMPLYGNNVQDHDGENAELHLEQNANDVEHVKSKETRPECLRKHFNARFQNER